jgi:hypothetical protein
MEKGGMRPSQGAGPMNTIEDGYYLFRETTILHWRLLYVEGGRALGGWIGREQYVRAGTLQGMFLRLEETDRRVGECRQDPLWRWLDGENRPLLSDVVLFPQEIRTVPRWGYSVQCGRCGQWFWGDSEPEVFAYIELHVQLKECDRRVEAHKQCRKVAAFGAHEIREGRTNGKERHCFI